jgi:hypothetical protein
LRWSAFNNGPAISNRYKGRPCGALAGPVRNKYS